MQQYEMTVQQSRNTHDGNYNLSYGFNCSEVVEDMISSNIIVCNHGSIFVTYSWFYHWQITSSLCPLIYNSSHIGDLSIK